MEILNLLHIDQQGYNELTFDAGCHWAEESYGSGEAAVVRSKQTFWKWISAQQRSFDRDFMAKTKDCEDVLKFYREELEDKLSGVWFSGRLEKKILRKEVFND